MYNYKLLKISKSKISLELWYLIIFVHTILDFPPFFLCYS